MTDREQAKLNVWFRQHECSLLDKDGLCVFLPGWSGKRIRLPSGEGHLHEVFWQRSDIPEGHVDREEILTNPMNLILVTAAQNSGAGKNEGMSKLMNRQGMLYLEWFYGYAKLNTWITSIRAKDKKTFAMCMSRG